MFLSGDYSPAGLVTEVLQVLCDQTECARECLYTSEVIDALLHPIHNVLDETEVCNIPKTNFNYMFDCGKTETWQKIEDTLSKI